MHLKRVELTNYRQHRKLDVDFNGSLIAILGQNGCGKSNFIGAIQFALTGEQPGFTKADLTTWGEKEGSVRLFFTAGSKNEEFCITRKTTGDVVLKIGTGENVEVIKQTRKVEEALFDRAGLDATLLKQVVFINQKEIDKIISANPKDREVALQKITGIDKQASIYERLRPVIAMYDRPQGFDDAIARAKVQLNEQSEICKVARGVLAKYDNALKSLPSKETLEGEVDRMAGAQSAVDEMLSVSERLASAQSSHEEALKTLGQTGSVSEEEEDELRKAVDADADVVRFLARLKELSDAAAEAKAAGDRSVRVAEEMLAPYKDGEPLEAEREAVKKLDAEQAAAEAEARSLRNMMREASSDGTCPLCGAPATQEDISRHVAEKLEAIEKKRRESVDRAAKARMDLDRREAAEQEAGRKVNDAKTRYEAAKSALQKAKDKNVDGVSIDMESFEVSYKGNSPSDLPSVERRLEENKRKLADAVATKARAKSARDNVARLSAQIDMLVQSKKTAAQRLADMGIDPETVGDDAAERCRKATAKARDNLDAYNGILRDMAAEKGKLEAAEKTIASTKTFIDDLVEKQGVEAKKQAKIDVCKRVRDAFRYNEIPRIYTQNVMRNLSAYVNEYLDQFCAPFVVDADEEGCGFRCRFIDGRTMPDPCPEAHMLSGGQKVTLAFAFHIAIYMMYGAQLGFLCFDEPTAYLDDANIGHMGELLEKVGAVARNRGLQIFMATHEKAIMPFLDSKIDLGALKGEE